MTSRTRFLQALLTALLCLGLPPAWATDAQDATPIAERFDAFERTVRTLIELPEPARVPTVAHAFDRLFGGLFTEPFLASVDDADLELLFRAADDVSFYPTGPRYVDLLAQAHRELVRRNQATPRHHAVLYGAWIQARRFAQARALYRAFPTGLEPLPELVAKPHEGPSVWSFDARQRRLLRRAFRFGEVDIVVLVHPLCHFSRNALDAVLSDPSLRAIFERHATLLLAPERGFRIDAVDAWNRAHSTLPMTFMDAQSDWPMFDAWGTPTFYFFRKGRLERKVEGWPKEGRVEALLEAARRVGLVPQAPR